MSTRIKLTVTVLAFTLVGFMLNPNSPPGAAVFGAPDESPVPPTGGQVAALVVVGLVESLAFGLGGGLLLFGLPSVRKVLGPTGYAVPAWIALVWLLVSWVPHTALHMTAGESVAKLVAIEYGFHVTLVVGGVLLARAFLAAARAVGPPERSAVRSAAARAE